MRGNFGARPHVPHDLPIASTYPPMYRALADVRKMRNKKTVLLSNMQINQTHFMVTGGTIPDRNNGKLEATDLTYFCPINSFKKCILGPPLKHRRRAHSCYTSNFKGKQYLNVVGGYITTSSSESTDQEVEYLVLSEITKGWQLSK